MSQGQTVPMETIVERIWGYDGTGDTAPVRGLVRRLRGKVEPNPTQPHYIVSLPGVGCRLEVEE